MQRGLFAAIARGHTVSEKLRVGGKLAGRHHPSKTAAVRAYRYANLFLTVIDYRRWAARISRAIIIQAGGVVWIDAIIRTTRISRAMERASWIVVIDGARTARVAGASVGAIWIDRIA